MQTAASRATRRRATSATQSSTSTAHGARVPGPQRRPGVRPALDDGEIVTVHDPDSRPLGPLRRTRLDGWPKRAGAAAAAAARTPRRRSATSSSTARAGARGRRSAPRRPGTPRAPRAASARPGTRSPSSARVGRSIASSTSRRKHLNPPVRSRIAQRQHRAARRGTPPRETIRRAAAPVRHAAARHVARAEREVGAVGHRGDQPLDVVGRRGRSRRPSPARARRPRAARGRSPARYAGPSPCGAPAVEHLDLLGISAASRSAISPVPSGEASSTISTRWPSQRERASTGSTARTMRSMFSASS